MIKANWKSKFTKKNLSYYTCLIYNFTDWKIEWQADRLTCRQTDRQTDRQAERQIDRQTGRQADWYGFPYCERFLCPFYQYWSATTRNTYAINNSFDTEYG